MVDVNQTVRAIADALDVAGIPYAVGGAIAYGYWGAARGTKDVDLNVFVPNDDIGQALSVLGAAGLKIDRGAAIESAKERGDGSGTSPSTSSSIRFRSTRVPQSGS
ncbi:MAG: hypothetical protein ACOZIN_10660 [Myxococcota bacterium]